MKHLLIAATCVVAFACAKGANAPACVANQLNRCSCGGNSLGQQACLPSGQAYGACDCTSACANDPTCVGVPPLLGFDMDQTGAALSDAGLKLPDPATLDGGFTVVQQFNDPPVEVLAQDPPGGTLVKPGTQINLTVTIPPDQESLGLPNNHFLVGALTQDTDLSAEAYYEAIDPGPFPKRATLQDWKDANGFGSGIAPDLEAQATYVSHADLGFGRRMHVRKQGKRVAFYVDNYLMPDDAVKGSNFFATVTMEWSPGPNGTDSDPFFTQFYVYDKKGDRIIDPKLDDHGTKNNPAVCLACHGGTTDLNYDANGGNLGAKFIPFDLDNLSYSTLPGAGRADQEAAFKILNEAVYATWDPNDPAYAPETPPVVQLIDNWYGGVGHPSPTFISGTVLSAWDVATGHDLYLNVFGRNCITCHAQREPFRNFSTFAKFDAEKALITTRVFEQGAMPLSEKGNRNFWLSYPNEAKILANYLGVPFKAPGTPVAHITVTHSGTQITAGTVVTLSGVTSQYAQTFTWTQTSGPAVQLTPAAADNSLMTFVAPAASVTFQLVVTLGSKSSTDNAAVAVLVAPSVPASVTATAGLNSATVTWTQTSDGGSPVLHSTVVASPGNITVQVPGNGTTANVTGLVAGTTYTFSVVATNEIDDSASSAPSNSVTVFTTPGSPTGVSGVRGDTKVVLSWTPPANTGGVPIVGYQITGNPAPTTPVSVPANGTGTQSLTIGGLVNGTSYVFSVAANNGALSSPAASPSLIPDVAPRAPTIVSALQTGTTSATVSWTPPPPNGGTPVTNYQITASNIVDGTGPTILVGVPSPLAATVPGLTANATYTFAVEAQNGFGLGATSGPSTAVFMAPTIGAPSQPINVSALFDGSTLPGEAATVSWTTPNNAGNSAITEYEITATPGPGGVTPSPVFVTAITPPPPSYIGRVAGLTGGVNYFFTVAAVNAQATGPGAASNSVAIEGRPQPPTLNNVTASAPGTVGGSGSLNAFWTAPTNNGGSAITGYTVSFGATNVGAAASATAINSGVLPTRCASYSVHLTASNSWGASSVSGSIPATNAVAPAQMSPPSGSAGVAAINLSWPAVAETGCTINYTLASNPAGVGFSTTALSGSTAAASCGYAVSGGVSSAHCGRSWTFTITPSNGISSAPASGSSAAIRPLVSYSGDNINAIWAGGATPGGTCTGCHFNGSGNPLLFDGTPAQNLSSILANSPPVITSPTANSYLIACTTGNTGVCPFTAMTSTIRFTASSAELATVTAWINDGHQN
jgi:mono/diheme cytochrome c family protein